MATPNSPFGPPAGGGDPVGPTGPRSRPLRPLPPPVPRSDLDVKLGALLAEGSTGATPPTEPRRRSAVTLIMGGALVIGAGLGLGWGIGRATRGTTSAEVTASPVVDGATGSVGAVSDAPPSADDPTVAAGTDDGSSVSAVTQPTTDGSDVSTAGPTSPEPGGVLTTPTAAGIAPSEAPTTATPPVGSAVSTGAVSTIAVTTSVSVAPPSTGAVPVPTIAATPGDQPTLLPTAFAVLEGGRLTVRGSFVDQSALDQAITALSPLGAGGFAVEAVVDPTVVGSLQVPVLVSDAALFQSGSAILGDGAQPVFDLFVSALAATPTSQLIIEGHTDSQGSDAYNFALSQQRLAAVFAYLTSKGVEPTRLELAPRGETEPVADNGTADGRSRNRRVELIFVA